MKRFLLVLFVLAAVVAPSLAVAPLEEDSIELSYVPNKFKDNWEINVMGGVTALFEGMNHKNLNTGNNFKGMAFGGEITATKWFNPNFGGRFGWQGEKQNSYDDNALFGNYFHMDMLWNWSNQFGGYDPCRIYNIIPYLHAGVYYNPTHNAAMAGGAGLLNRFRINDNWKINLDIRGNITSSSKFNVGGSSPGITGLLGIYAGFSYCFNEATWQTKKSAGTHYKADLDQLQEKYNALLAEADALKNKPAEVKEKAVAAAAEAVDTVRIATEAAAQVLRKVEEMTVYYDINSDQLSGAEKLHLATYLSVIRHADPKCQVHYTVIGRADSATGRREYNEALAARRAETLKNELIKNGVSEEYITVKSEVVNSGNVRVDRASVVQFSK